jgi:hypothetical protein
MSAIYQFILWYTNVTLPGACVLLPQATWDYGAYTVEAGGYAVYCDYIAYAHYTAVWVWTWEKV